MATKQANLTDWSTEPTDPLPFEAYGPTMQRPIPTVETNRTVWRERLRQAGFDPMFCDEEQGIRNVHVQRGFHPADESRLDREPGQDRQAFERAEAGRA